MRALDRLVEDVCQGFGPITRCKALCFIETIIIKMYALFTIRNTAIYIFS